MSDFKTIESIKEFDDFVSENENAIIKFSAEWCGPCKVLGSLMKNMTEDEYKGCLVAEVDTENCDELCTKFSIRNLPTVLFYRNGEMIRREVGAMNKSKLLDIINDVY